MDRMAPELPKLEIVAAHQGLQERNAQLEAVINDLEVVLGPLLQVEDMPSLLYEECSSTSPLMRSFYDDLNTFHHLTVRLQSLLRRISN